MSGKQANLRVGQESAGEEGAADRTEQPGALKTPGKRLLPDQPPSIFSILSPLPFPPKIDARPNDSFFPQSAEMREVNTPLPRETSRFMPEAQRDPSHLAIVRRIIFESDREDPASASEEEESSSSSERPSPSKTPSQEEDVPQEPSESRSLESTSKREKVRVSRGLETPSGKRVQCNCRKSRCLKLYCDCFRLNLTCDGCNCVGCHNLESFTEERSNAIMLLMDRNPDPFGVKIDEHRHVKGCNCKKSGCQKKYCECYQAGLPCGDNCKCEDCKNNHAHDHDRPARTAKKERRMLQV